MEAKDMIADFYTKPLQEQQIMRIRDEIMGVDTMVNM